MFDETTGQVFTEWSTTGDLIQRHDIDWHSRPPWRESSHLKTIGTQGPRSLIEMATHVVVANIEKIRKEDLEGMPSALVWRIWQFFEARGVNLHAWKILSGVLITKEGQQADENIPLGLYRFRKHICHPKGDLRTYLSPLSSPTFDFITHLVISGGCEFTMSELLTLADVRNLGVLELVQMTTTDGITTPQINDRLIRGWSEKQDPFPLLRILRIWGDQSVSQNSLQWVTKLPSLRLYDVQAFRDDWKTPQKVATDFGWEMAEASTGPGDSLIGYLAQLSPTEAPIQNMARTAESDLVALCSDSRCAIRFDPTRSAPSLMSYLEGTQRPALPSWDPDAALQGARACHGIAFEAWAFWLYSFVGQLCEDADLERRGAQPGYQAIAGPFVLPSKPMASLFLGHNKAGGITSRPSYVGKGLFRTKKYIFTRRTTDGQRPPASESTCLSTDAAAEESSIKVKAAGESGPKLRTTKRRRIADMLQSMR